MTHGVLVNFLDPHLGKCSASVATVEGGCGSWCCWWAISQSGTSMPGLNAVQFGRARFLSAAGEKGSLPQSRQIGWNYRTLLTVVCPTSGLSLTC